MSTDEALLVSDEKSRTAIKKDLNRTLFVEAGAGTGKTTALVGRIVELVLTDDSTVQVPLSQIAAITFTEAAAAELRERIRIKFEEALRDAQAKGNAERVDRCRKALADADIAAVSTLHAFAQRLLSEFPVEVGVPPRVEVIDEVRSQLAFDRRWSLFLDSLYDDPDLEEFIVRASILGVKLSGPQLRNIAQQFDDNWDRLLGVEVPATRPTPIDFAGVREHIHLVRELPKECSDQDDKFCAHIRNEYEPVFGRFDQATTDHERLRVVGAISNLGPGNGGAKGNWGGDVASAKQVAKDLFAYCTDLLAAVAGDTLTQFAGKIAVFTRESAEVRRSEGLLEFHDLLVLAHILLRTAPEARALLSQRYRVLMLDEFQDTDPIQISLALLLVSSVEGQFDGAWSDLSPTDGRLFMVGDPKQSIYRFRRADIALFLEARARFTEGEVSLQRNFRTVEPIVATVNALFSEVMAEETESQAKYSPLVANRTDASASDHRPIVFGGPHSVTAREIREAEAADVASLIVDIQSNKANWQIFKKDVGWVDPKLSDITILLPTRTSMSQLSHALDDKDIPFRADTGTLVYETQEIKDLLSVLSAVDDPSNEIALVAALRSPLYACGYDDLYAFRNGGGAFDIRVPIPDALQGTTVAAGIEHMHALTKRRWWDEPSQLLMRVIDDRFAMALPAHGRRARDTWRRIRYVVDQARAFAEAGGGDLREYLEWTRLQGADGSRAHEPMLAEPDDEAVQIMTIHGSKGLEFPITIISGLTTQLGRGRSVGEVIWGEAGEMPEVKASSTVSTKHFDLAKELDDEMSGPERDRLLYVALTRAKDHLVMSGHHVVDKHGKPKLSHGGTLYGFAQATGADLVRTPTGQSSLFSPTAHLSRDDDVPTFALPTRSDWSRAHRARVDNAQVRSVWSATAIAQAASASNFTTGHDDWIDDSVSDDDEGLDGQQLPPQVYRRGRAGTAIGTAVHGVLQFLDLAAVDEADIDSLSDAQAWAESVPEHIETIAASVRSALQAPIVASCSTARHWKELFVAAPVGGVTIEGYVDLLVETPEGLVVVDYKTDSVRNVAEVDAKLDRYSLQGAAYAAAVEAATGLTVVDVQFVFARPDGPVVRSVDDLAVRRQQVIAATQPAIQSDVVNSGSVAVDQ